MLLISGVCSQAAELKPKEWINAGLNKHSQACGKLIAAFLGQLVVHDRAKLTLITLPHYTGWQHNGHEPHEAFESRLS